MTICLILGIPLTCYLIMRIVRRRKWNRLFFSSLEYFSSQRQSLLEHYKGLEAYNESIKPWFDPIKDAVVAEIIKFEGQRLTEREEVLPKVLIARPQEVESARRILQASTKMKVIIRKKSPYIDIEKQKQADEIARNFRIMPEEYVISYEE